MKRRGILSLAFILTSGIVLLPGAGLGQEKSLKEQIVGSWTLVQAVDTNADGTKTNPWGANPKGAYMFGADGRFTQMLFHTDLPKIDNRMAGTPDQNKAIAQGIVAMYGSYTVDEASKTISVKFEGSSLPSSSAPRASGLSRRSTPTSSGAQIRLLRPEAKPSRSGSV